MNINAFAITSLAGISTILGLFILNGKREEGIIPKALGFSAGVMIFVSLFDLLPSAIQYFQEEFIIGFHFLFCLLFILFGFLISILMNEAVHKRIENSNNLYQIGILSMLAIILHNIPEGIITYLTTTIEYKTGILLAFSIACHNIPEGICIAVPIYYSTKKKWKAIKAVLLSAISEPVGAFIAYLFLQDNLSNDWYLFSACSRHYDFFSDYGNTTRSQKIFFKRYSSIFSIWFWYTTLITFTILRKYAKIKSWKKNGIKRNIINF